MQSESQDPVSVTSIRIMLADAHTLVRAGLCLLIGTKPGMTVVSEAGDQQEAVSLAARAQPEMILLELNLSEGDSVAVIPELLGAAPNARILLVTAIYDTLIHYRAVQAGAVGVVLKNQAPEVLLKAIAKVHSGEVWLDRATIATMLTQMSRGEANGDPDAEKIASLSQREREVITMIGKGLKNRQIADTLSISEVTVRHHLTSVFSKLGIADRLELIIYAYQHHLIDLPR